MENEIFKLSEVKNILPLSIQINANTIADDLIGIRPNESWEEATNRFILEKRNEKLKHIIKKIKEKRKGGY